VLPFLIPAAFAQDDEIPVVLVSSLQARNDAARGLASVVEGALAQAIDKQAGILTRRVEDAPDFDDYSARIYMQSCPAGDTVGCTLVVGERANATLAVTGSVQALARTNRVQIDILDIANARVLVSFQSEVEDVEDPAFADGVANVVLAAARGEIGEEKDIRGGAETEDGDGVSDEEWAKQLNQLTGEMGGVTVVEGQNRRIARPEFTVEDIAEKMKSEAQKPWERLGMSPAEYLRFKNSGLALYEWRQGSRGRQGQVVLRPLAGVYNGPVNTAYYARYAQDDNFDVIDAYGAQAMQTGTAGAFGGTVGYGLAPVLEVGVEGAVTTGSFQSDIFGGTLEDLEKTTATEIEPDQASSWWLGAYALVAPFPMAAFRPDGGAGLLFFQGQGSKQHIDATATGVPAFDGSNLVLAELFVGGEARLSKHLDVCLKLPVHLRVAGDATQSIHEPKGDVVQATAPKEAGAVAAGVLLGIQVRLGGKKVEETRLIEELDE
jgi:hypothetical protein